MHHALVRAQPTQLAVGGGDLSPKPAHVCSDGIQRPAHHMRRQHANRGDTNLITTADGERQTMALQSLVAVRVQNHIGCRVVGRSVHGIRTVQTAGCWETNVLNGNGGDFHNDEEAL